MPPSEIRLLVKGAAQPKALEVRSAKGQTLLRVALADTDRTVLLPEMAALATPGESLALVVEWSADGGKGGRAQSSFAVLGTTQRRKLASDLVAVHQTMGAGWNRKDGILLRSVAFASANCQGEAAELLLRYRALAPNDRDVHALLALYFKDIDQPERSQAALALASAGR